MHFDVAIGAAYARSMYHNDGIKKVAIIDFDVHHGNGTEAVIRNLVPSVSKATIRLPFAVGTMETPCYRPSLDETGVNNVFFASAHGYGPRQLVHLMGLHPGMFYPSSGRLTHHKMFDHQIQQKHQVLRISFSRNLGLDSEKMLE